MPQRPRGSEGAPRGRGAGGGPRSTEDRLRAHGAQSAARCIDLLGRRAVLDEQVRRPPRRARRWLANGRRDERFVVLDTSDSMQTTIESGSNFLRVIVIDTPRLVDGSARPSGPRCRRCVRPSQHRRGVGSRHRRVLEQGSYQGAAERLETRGLHHAGGALPGELEEQLGLDPAGGEVLGVHRGVALVRVIVSGNGAPSVPLRPGAGHPSPDEMIWGPAQRTL